jgi:hypothetical protein
LLEGFSLQNSESLLHPPPALVAWLSTWSTATTQQAIAFCFLAPWLLSFETIQGITDPIQDLVNTHTLHTLLRDLTRAHKKWQYASFSQSAPPFLASALPSIMQQPTSEALLTASQWFADLCLPSPYFWLMINQNLCLHIIEPGIICPCGQEINIYGDLFFSMQKIQQNATKQLNPWLRGFCCCWNWSTCRSHFQQTRCTRRTRKPCTTQSNIQTCQYIDQFDTYICQSSHYTILMIGYWCNDHSPSSYHWWWWSIYFCGFCYKSSPAVWEKEVWWP